MFVVGVLERIACTIGVGVVHRPTMGAPGITNGGLLEADGRVGGDVWRFGGRDRRGYGGEWSADLWGVVESF